MTKIMTPSAETTMTDGQIDKAGELFRSILKKHRAELSMDAVQQVLGNNTIWPELFATFRKHAEVTMSIAPRGTVEVMLAEPHDPDVFFQTSKGLYVWDGFRSRIVANAKQSEAGTSFKLKRAELMEDLSDTEVEARLPKNHLFDETGVCAIIAGFIAKQANGEEGALLNNGYANLFYTGSCVVGVYWGAVGCKWRVGMWERDDVRWDAGDWVFSPATEA